MITEVRVDTENKEVIITSFFGRPKPTAHDEAVLQEAIEEIVREEGIEIVSQE